MRRIVLATVVAATFILTGCSAPGDTTETAVSPVEEETEPGPSTEEFASIIAESRRDIDEWLDTWDDNSCSTIGVSSGTDIFACELSLTSGALVAETARLKLEAATKEDAPVYIGQPSESISVIWQSTEDAATAASKAGKEILRIARMTKSAPARSWNSPWPWRTFRGSMTRGSHTCDLVPHL